MNTDAKLEKQLRCPSCSQTGRQVSPVTLRALLKDEFVSEIMDNGSPCCATDGNQDTGCQPFTGDTGWRFCESQDCDVVYFSEEGDISFTSSQLRVAVGVKEKTGERPLCYCFGHSVASIKGELQNKGRSDSLINIRQKMKAPGCR